MIVEDPARYSRASLHDHEIKGMVAPGRWRFMIPVHDVRMRRVLLRDHGREAPEACHRAQLSRIAGQHVPPATE
jgi:hypothetical protein